MHRTYYYYIPSVLICICTINKDYIERCKCAEDVKRSPFVGIVCDYIYTWYESQVMLHNNYCGSKLCTMKL